MVIDVCEVWWYFHCRYCGDDVNMRMGSIVMVMGLMVSTVVGWLYCGWKLCLVVVKVVGGLVVVASSVLWC